MRVRIVSGNQAGQVVDLPLDLAQSELATGFAVAVETAEPDAAAMAPPAPPPEPDRASIGLPPLPDAAPEPPPA
jgi:hypothetical protein